MATRKRFAMTDDIVTRLRDVGFCGVETQQEAADEIERLRADVELLKDSRQRQRDMVDVFLELTEDQEMDSASMYMLHRAAGKPDAWERTLDRAEWFSRDTMTARKMLWPDEEPF